MKFVLVTILLSGCVTPAPTAPSTRIDKNEMLICRAMCGKNTKSYSPMTGECECYPNR